MSQVNIGTEPSELANEKCTSDPNFAVICAFLAEFGQHPSIVGQQANVKTNIPDIGQLQSMLEKSEVKIDEDLIKFHVKLLRKLKKSVSVDKWEKALVKFAHTYSVNDAWELERFGYRRISLQLKCRLLKNLIESQFDYNEKFKKDINTKTASELRKSPLGRDRLGNAYWYQVDEEANLRVYKEDPDEETWELVAKTEQQLLDLIEQLRKGDTFISPEKDIDDDDMDAIPLEEEDSMQCDITNIIRDTGPPPSSGMASRADSNITTPANYHSDNDELDERISVKSSLNPSRESSLPPDEVKRETHLIKSREPDVTAKVDIKNDQDEKKETKTNNSPLVKKEEIDSSVNTKYVELKCENVKSISPSEEKSIHETSLPETKINSITCKQEKEAHIAAPTLFSTESKTSKSMNSDAQNIDMKSHQMERNEIKEPHTTGVMSSDKPTSNAQVLSAGSDNFSKDFQVSESLSSDVKLKRNLSHKKSLEDSSKSDIEAKDRLEKEESKQNFTSKSEIKDTEKKCTEEKPPVSSSITVPSDKEKHSSSDSTTDHDQMKATEACSETSSPTYKDNKSNTEKPLSEQEKDLSSEKPRVVIPTKNVDDSSPKNVSRHKPDEPTKPNQSIKHPIASMLSNSMVTKPSVPEISPKPVSKPKHSIESMLSSTYKPSTDKIQPHRPIGQLNMVTPFIPVISSDPVVSHSRPSLQENTTPEKVNEVSPNTSHLPQKRALNREHESSSIRPENITEKKPRLEQENKTEDTKSTSSFEPRGVTSSIIEPVQSVKGNGNGADNTSGNNVSDEISEPVFLIVGRGLGMDCDVGNPRTENGRPKTTNGFSSAKKEPKGVKNDSEENENESEDENDSDHDISKQSKFRGRGRPRGRGRGRGRGASNNKPGKIRKRSDSSDKDISGESEASVGDDDNEKKESEKPDSKTNEDMEENYVKPRQGRGAKGRGRPPGSANKKSKEITSNGNSGSLKDFHQPKAKEENGTEDVDADTQELVSRLSRRSSGRIAMIRIKEAERRQREEEEALASYKEKDKETKKKRKKVSDDSSEDETAKKEGKRRKRKKKKKPEDLRGQEHLKQFSKFSSGSESGEEDEEGEEIEEEAAEGGDGDELFKSDHEFSCESDVPDDDWQPVKHARTATKKRGRKKAEVAESSEEEADDFACKKCSTADHPEWILLCDKCDDGWHASCLRPPLMVIPEGTWYCPDCSHTMLIEKLEENLKEFQVLFKKKEAEIKRKERLAYVSMSLANVVSDRPRRKAPNNRKYNDYETGDESSEEEHVIKESRPRKAPRRRRRSMSVSEESESEGSSSSSSSSEDEKPKIPIVKQRRAAKNVNYNTNEYDEMIKSALEQEEHYADQGTYDEGGKNIGVLYEEEEENEEDDDKNEFDLKHKSGQGQGKDMANILDASDTEEDADEDGDNEEKKPKPLTMSIEKTGGNQTSSKKKKKLTGLDASDDNDGDSGSDFEISESSSDSDFEQERGDSTEEEMELEYGKKKKSRSKGDGGRRRSNRERRVLYDDMDDFVVSGSDDSDESYTKRKKKSKGNSRSYKDDSWDSDVTSDEDYRKRKPVKKAKSSGNKKSSNRPKSKSKSRKYSDDSDVEFETTKIDKKNILNDDEDNGRGNRRTRGKRTKYNLILDDSSESEAEKSKGAGKQIKNCIDSTEEEYDAKEEEDEDEASDEDPDESIDDDDSKEKSDNDSGDINDQVQIDSERTSTQT